MTQDEYRKQLLQVKKTVLSEDLPDKEPILDFIDLLIKELDSKDRNLDTSLEYFKQSFQRLAIIMEKTACNRH